MPVITPNPFKDPFSSVMIRRMDLRMFEVLNQFKGKEPTSSLLKTAEDKLKVVINNSLVDIGRYSLQEACKEVNVVCKPQLVTQLYKDCRSRADFAAHSIISTTGQAFGVLYAALSKKKALGHQRSTSNAQYEGSRIFFEYRMKGWSQRYGVRKRWYCASNLCEICQENEDDELVEIEEPFSSGDYGPPLHLNCECLMSLIF